MNEVNKEITTSSIILSGNRALLGEVRANMRNVSISYNQEKKIFSLYIYYDFPLTEEEKDYDIAGGILTEIISDFPQAVDLTWEEHEVILPYPARIPQKGICIYSRYEPAPDIDE